MHPNSAFRWDDHAALRGFAEAIGFGMLFAATADGPRVAHIPFVFLDADRIGFHVARGNGIAKHLDGRDALLVVNGPDGYVSPDWYELDNNQVPTWNYLAVEFEGTLSRMETAGLVAQMDALTATHESRLSPKPVWTRSKMDGSRFEKMIEAGHGFELRITGWRGTAKLSQNKTEAARLNAARAAQASGNRALAHLMRELPNG